MSAQPDNRIDRTFAALRAAERRRAALVPYIAAGDPSDEATVPLMHALVANGADILELGVPFSDPSADGPVVQRATQRALDRGMNLSRVLELVAAFRRDDQNTPVVLMGYANPIERMGLGQFAARAAEAGVDGVLTVDYTPEESADYTAALARHGIAPIFLLAPTSSEQRIRQVAALARGYVYYVSLKGVTGAGHLDIDDVERRLTAIREHVTIPVGVGFGIRDAASAARIGGVADAVVIGSKLIETIEQAVADAAPQAVADKAAEAAGAWLKTVRDAL
ncbi:tryptophan synthase subunit alpha [Corticimicrobacter populi]|uniref:Tryptophan synthase alpha chain n=1 Tax=Corticimicrobacter populi TaxID=2175229 RepID=A0A2V1K6B0_9BURK|nr:tryptophan synthase subunit alpha [Corticimicrobacter populi]PWF25219.1 tryptophan synthase subunit alpha [Corticimicrobacter populi]